MFTDFSLGSPVDVGAAWIHGKRQNPVYDLLVKPSPDSSTRILTVRIPNLNPNPNPNPNLKP